MDKKYFDAAASIAGYEEKTGCKASDYLAEMTRLMEPIINKAFHDGYVAGAMAAWAAEEANQKQTGSET
jgi:hypothetical protein